MKQPSDQDAAQKHDPLLALRERNFQLYAFSRIFASLGSQMLQAVMAWQVYAITHSAYSLGLLGLARFVPALCASLIGGLVADSYDRRKITVVTQLVPLSCAVTLALATAGGWVHPALIYGLVVCIGLGSAFEAPARTALLPAIVKQETFANAVTVNNIFQKLGSTSGLLGAGVLIAAFGVAVSYSAYVGCMLIAVLPVMKLRYVRPPEAKPRASLHAIKEGINFVRHRQVLLGAMTLDMFAVIFGGAQALLPVYATDILHAGSLGYGVLTASLQIGAFIMAGALVLIPPIRRSGRALVYTVIAFGAATMLFGLSRNLYMSIFLYGLIGAADQISVVMRQTTIQLATPDDLRGRVSAVNQVFVQASSQIGAIESGVVAGLAGATFSVVSGGFGSILVAVIVGVCMPQLFRYRIPGRGEAAAEPPAESVQALEAFDALEVEEAAAGGAS